MTQRNERDGSETPTAVDCRSSQQPLRPDERLLADFFENASVGLHWIGPDGKILWVNQTELDMLGYQRDEYVGRRIADFHADPSVIADILNRLSRGETLDKYPARMRAKDGSIREVIINSNVLFENGEFVHTRCFTIDVTEQKRAEAAQQASEAQFRALAAAPVLIWMSGPNKEAVFFNQTWLDFTGRPAEQQVGDGWLELVHPDDAEDLNKVCTESFRTRQSFTTEFRLRRADGDYRWLLDTGTPQFDENGTFRGFVGSCVDITARKQSEEQFTSFMQHLPGLAWIKDLNGRYVYANDAAESTFCVSREMLYGRTDDEVFPEQVAAEFRANDRRALASETGVQVIESLKHDDGILHHSIVSKFPIPGPDGRPLLVGGMAIDITEHLQAEAALREGEARTRIVQQAAHWGVFEYDCIAQRYCWTPELEALYGLQPGTLEGTSAGWRCRLHPEDREPAERGMQQALECGEYSQDFRVVWDDGSVRWLFARAKVFRDADGRPLRMLGVHVDITDRKRAEAALKAKEAELGLIAETTPLILSRCSRDLRYRFVNRAAAALFGRKPDEVIGRPIVEFMGEHTFSLIEPRIEQVLKGEPVEFEAELTYRAGDPRWVHVNYIPEFDEHGDVEGWIASIADITEQKQAAAAVHASEQRFRTMANVTPAIVWTASPDGTVTWSSDRWFEYTGLAREESRDAWQKVLHSDDVEMCLSAWAKALQAGGDYEVEVRYRRHDGQYRWFLTRATPIRDDQQRVVEWCGSTTDIHDHKCVEEALRRHSQEVQTLLETLPIGVLFAHDPACTRITANRAGYHLLRMANDANISKSGPARDQPRHFRILQQDVEVSAEGLPVQRAARGEQVRDEEIDLVFDDGTTSHFLVSAVPLVEESGRVRGAVASMLDVTDRKRMEQSLRFLADASKSLATLVEFKATLQQVARFAVPAFADWCAVDLPNADGVLERVAFSHVDANQVPLAAELFRRYPPNPAARRGPPRVLRTGQSELVSEIGDAVLQEATQDDAHAQLLRELGLRSYMCVPLRSNDRTLGTVFFAYAASGRQYTADDLSLAEDLAHRAAISMESARLYQELRDADRRKDEFLAMLAHELRNPLAPIQSGLDLLAMEDGAQQETIGLMQGQVQHLVRLVDDLLDVSRIMRGRIELKKEPVELATLFRRSVEAVQAQRGNQYAHELVVSVPDQPVLLDGDPIRLLQVIENLLSNAFKYTHAGGRIELHAQQDNGQAVISVTDNGIGIEAGLLPEVFELFTQSSRSLDRAQGGLGIGLTVVRRLVDLHGGTVAAYSDGPGQGSRFVLHLPTTNIVERQPERVPKQGVYPARRILVVDDMVGAALVLAKLLRKLGEHEVQTAHDGVEALKKIRKWRPEVVILDIGLPGMDGFHVAQAVREDPALDDVVLVALTGYGQKEDLQRSKEVGFDEHLVKPPSVDQMRSILTHGRLRST